MTNVLLLGAGFTADERARLTGTFDSVSAAQAEDVAKIDASILAGIKAVAFKGHMPLGAAIMDQLEGLGVIANFGVGYDAIDVTAASARGIKVTNTPDVLNDDVADLAVVCLTHCAMTGGVGRSTWNREGSFAHRSTCRH
jgi:lactate dehydrogenase-like 2-hydroxyacid dehydrogenase